MTDDQQPQPIDLPEIERRWTFTHALGTGCTCIECQAQGAILPMAAALRECGVLLRQGDDALPLWEYQERLERLRSRIKGWE